jgi:AcrR family transcriptional regulator
VSHTDSKPATEAVVDGRRQRSEASRDRIVQALMELVIEGDTSPSAEAVAARAGVGLRTVFRHFENMEALYQQLYGLMVAELRPTIERPFAAQDWKQRTLEMLERRIGIFERIMPLKIAADVHRHRSPFLAGQAAEFVRAQRAALRAALPDAQQTNAALFEPLDLLLSFDTWRRLRKDQQLTRSRARTVLQRLLRSTMTAD